MAGQQQVCEDFLLAVLAIVLLRMAANSMRAKSFPVSVLRCCVAASAASLRDPPPCPKVIPAIYSLLPSDYYLFHPCYSLLLLLPSYDLI